MISTSRSPFLAASLLCIAACGSTAFELQGTPARSSDRLLSIDALYGDAEQKVDFSGSPPTNFVWLDDARLLWPKTDPKTKKVEWLEVDADTGKTAPFAAIEKVEAALAALPDVGGEKAKKAARTSASAWAGAPKALLYTIDVRGTADQTDDPQYDLFVYSTAKESAVRATRTPEAKEEEAELSPDGTLVAYVRGNDLYVTEVATGTERRLTSDGSDRFLNGKLDWLYQEEIYGRGTWRAFWWSPDSRRIAFLRLDEEGVPIYTLADETAVPEKVDASPYPHAGEPNPKVALGMADVRSGEVEWVDLSKYDGGEFLIVDVAWSPANDLTFQVQDRVQTWLDLNVVDTNASSATTLFREKTLAWVNLHGGPKWLADGTFLWFSETTGWKHLVRHDRTGKRLGAVTSGRFEVRDLRGVDEAQGWVYFTSTERSPIGTDEYRVRLDGTGRERLTPREGTSAAKFNPSFTRFIGQWSDASTPAQVRMHRADGSEVRAIHTNEVETLAEHGFVKPEFLKVKTRDGFEMEAMLIKPPDFDPSRQYPVIQPTYAGPHAPSVKNAWGGTSGMYLQLLAQHGFVVWVCDNRSASGKGAESEWTCYRRCGPGELADIEDGLAWLKQQRWVDAERIGIYGWSYGGFMVSYAMTHSTSFAAGVAGGPVTDWRNYDTIYTERYMLTPQTNEKGYDETSVVKAAEHLHGELLVVHGAMDDNVHPRNTMQLAHALQRAGKSFRMMLYPKQQHSLGDKKLERHFRATMLEFFEETLLRPKG